ncbi:DUF2382 domain-containing protein [Cryptosporangium sp. NPDC048952]|uniref:DUF2382 domain-containing protein n=1 Tax=Cryptosporangium sp. NPDC048952 TaxID=3363961 RepID=UPI00370F98DD
MFSTEQINQLTGDGVYGADGDKIGSIGTFYSDDRTGQPEWVTVTTGLFGTKQTFVPLAQAQPHPDGLAVPLDKKVVKDAPNIEPDGRSITPEQEAELYRYYGLGPDATLPGQHSEERYTTERDARDQVAAADPGAMTRSEERLRTGTETVETGRVRLRKHVVTETEQVEVPVSHEEVRLEREPITDANREPALSGEEITEAEHEIILHAEKPVVTTEAVPVERVRVGTETVTDTETVTGDVRKERIELDDPNDSSAR